LNRPGGEKEKKNSSHSNSKTRRHSVKGESERQGIQNETEKSASSKASPKSEEEEIPKYNSARRGVK